MDPKIIKILWYLGLISVILGLAIAAGGTLSDYSVGGLGFGDPLRGALAIALAAVIFGIFLLQFTANENLSYRIKDLVQVNDSLKVEVPGFKGMKGIVKLVGMILTPMSALAMIVIAFKDYSPPTTFNIGSIKFFMLFGSGLMGFVGLGLMAFHNQFLTTSLQQATKKLKDFVKDQEKELADMLEAAEAKAAVVTPPQYYYQPQQSYYEPQQQASVTPQPPVEAPIPKPLPPPPVQPKPKIKTPPPLPPPVVKMSPPPLPPPLKPKEKTEPTPIELEEDEPEKSVKDKLVCKNCGEPIKAIWKFCPNCDSTFDKKTTPSKDTSTKPDALDDILSNETKKDNKPTKNKTPGTTVNAPKTMGTCPKCGRTVKSQWKICPFCGLDFRQN